MNDDSAVEKWLLLKVGILPKSSLGWFRAGVGFYNKKQFSYAIECLERSVELDPNNYNAFQIMARACISVNRRDDAIRALKESVKLDNPSDWQLLVELTNSKQGSGSSSSKSKGKGQQVEDVEEDEQIGTSSSGDTGSSSSSSG